MVWSGNYASKGKLRAIRVARLDSVGDFVVWEHFLGVRSDLGTYSSSNVLCNFLPVFVIKVDC